MKASQHSDVYSRTKKRGKTYKSDVERRNGNVET